MTMPIKFDTLEYARKLVEAGIPADQAEAQANALSDVLAEATVGPSELVLFKSDMLARMELLRSDVLGRIELVKHDLDILRQDLENFKTSVNTKFTTVFWMLGISMALHAVTIAALIEVLTRLP